MNTKNKIICGVVVAALCGGGFFWYQNNNKSTTQVTDEEMGYSRTFTLAKGDLESTVDVSGVVVSAVETEVTTDISAKVVKLNVKEGDKVKKGDIICVLDSSDIDRQIKDLQENKDTGGSGPSSSAVTKATNALTDAQKRFSTRYNMDGKNIYKDSAIEKKHNSLQEDADKAYNALVNADSSVTDAQKAVDAAQTAYDQAGVSVNLDQKIADYSNATKAVDDAEKAVDEAKRTYDHYPTPENQKALEEAENNLKDAKDALSDAKKALEDAKSTLSDKQDALDNAQKALEEAKKSAQYAEAQKAYDIAKAALEENEKLVYTQYATDKDAVLSAQEAYDSLFSGGGSSSTSNTELEKLQEQKENCTLRAESTGEITSLSVKLGSIVKGSVAIIQSTDNLIFQVSIPEESINKVKTGLMATVKASSIDEPVTGKLTQISSTTGLTTSTEGGASSSSGDGSGYKAQITLDKPGGLHIGSKAQGSIILSSKKNIFVVPVDAVGNDEGLSFIRVCQEDGTYKKIAVEVGESNDTMVEISGDALVEGLEVLSDAYYEDLITEAKTSEEY